MPASRAGRAAVWRLCSSPLRSQQASQTAATRRNPPALLKLARLPTCAPTAASARPAAPDRVQRAPAAGKAAREQRARPMSSPEAEPLLGRPGSDAEAAAAADGRVAAAGAPAPACVTPTAAPTSAAPTSAAAEQPAAAAQPPLCRICLQEDEPEALEAPCSCSGSMRWAHNECIQRWIDEKHDMKVPLHVCVCRTERGGACTALPRLARVAWRPQAGAHAAARPSPKHAVRNLWRPVSRGVSSPAGPAAAAPPRGAAAGAVAGLALAWLAAQLQGRPARAQQAGVSPTRLLPAALVETPQVGNDDTRYVLLADPATGRIVARVSLPAAAARCCCS